jgi:hypothetical protein
VKAAQLYPAVADVLFREWDPIGANDNEQCRDEYNRYARALTRLLLEGAGEYKLASRLSEFARVSMGLSHTDDELHRRVARRLLARVAER